MPKALVMAKGGGHLACANALLCEPLATHGSICAAQLICRDVMRVAVVLQRGVVGFCFCFVF